MPDIIKRRPQYQPIKITKLGSTVRLDCATGEAQVEVTNHEDMNSLAKVLNAGQVKWETIHGKPSGRTYFHGLDGRGSEEVKEVLYISFDYNLLVSKIGNFLDITPQCRKE